MADEAVGTFVRPKHGSHIRFYKCGRNLCGRVARIKNPKLRDVLNRNPKLRKRKILGIRIFHHARKMTKNIWHGRVYNTEDGRTYHGYVKVLNKGKKIEMKGCLRPGRALPRRKMGQALLKPPLSALYFNMHFSIPSK